MRAPLWTTAAARAVALMGLAALAPAASRAQPSTASLMPLPTVSQSADPPPHPPLAPSTRRRAAQLKLAAPANGLATTLSERERAVQMLNRFTYGPRPGEVERVLAQGPRQWFEAQLNPASIPDPTLDKRLAAYPDLTLPPEQLLILYPDAGRVRSVMDGKTPYPADPLLKCVYEVQVAKARAQLSQNQSGQNQSGQKEAAGPLATPEEAAARKKLDQATAARVAGVLFGLPRTERLPALEAMPVEDRIAFVGNVAGEQRDILFNALSPREREAIQAMGGGVGASYRSVDDLAQAKILRSILSERQLAEVMTDFWFNHFNVFAPKDADQWYTASYEREVIRPHALGRFRDLLLATARSPAMLVYLDNWLSIGPDSAANGVNPANPNSKRGTKGLNENYGREVMELHTLGVNGGYTQADVTHLSAILTGWSVDRPNQGGPFLYDPRKHEPGTKQWLGYTIDDQGDILGAPANAPALPRVAPDVPDGMRQGVTALDILAASPRTAHFISYLLAQRFLADQPPPAVVDRMTAAYLGSDGDIQTVLRTLVDSPEFNSHRFFRNKVKTPAEFLFSAFRATGTDPQNPGAISNALNTIFGEPLYKALPPTGYYITADHWMNTQALMGRLNFADQLTRGAFAGQKFDAPRLLGLSLMTNTHPSPGSAATEHLAGRTPAALAPARSVQVTAYRAASAASASPTPPGADAALRLLEGALIEGEVSPRTDAFIHGELAAPASDANPAATLNLLTALLLGSPEFQVR